MILFQMKYHHQSNQLCYSNLNHKFLEWDNKEKHQKNQEENLKCYQDKKH